MTDSQLRSGDRLPETDPTQSAAGPRFATVREFLTTEAGGAVVLLTATIAALVLANTAARSTYEAIWATELGLTLGAFAFSLDLSHWINDGLMTFFFLLVGLEIRREFDVGEFRERRRLAVPVIAAVGGMVLPVLLFMLLNAGRPEARGWAMVMATDTAFAVGVLALVGRRSSMRLRMFLLTLVIVDDVVAISVIALFYTTTLEPLALGAAVAMLGVMWLLRLRGTDAPIVFAALGVAIWFASYVAGIHPTVAGVAMGLITGAYTPARASLREAVGVTRAFRQDPSPALAAAAARRITTALSPNDRLQHAIHPWSSYLIVPLFALANAGIDLSGDIVGRVLGSPLALGLIVALVVGKPLGISIGAWIATRPRLGGLPLSVGWPGLIAASAVCGIGFTVSLLIANLSYADDLLESAKLGILIASGLAAVVSVSLFLGMSRLPREFLRRADARAARPLTDLVERMDPTRDHLRGNVDAPVTLLEYGDYECPHCGEAAPVVKEILARMPGKVLFVFRHLPLPEIHPNAALAAEAAEAAGKQDRFWEMHDLLFERQDALQPADLEGYAREIGVDADLFERELHNGRYSHRVAEDVESAEAAGVVGTPTFFINEVIYRGPRDVQSLSAAIARAGELATLRRQAAAEAADAEAAAEEAAVAAAEDSAGRD